MMRGKRRHASVCTITGSAKPLKAKARAGAERLWVSGAKASEIANFATRQKKESRPREELFAEWQQIGRDHHWSTKELSWLLHGSFAPRNLEGEQSAAATEAMAKLTTQESHFSSRQILQAVAECCQGRGLGADTALALRERALLAPELVRLCEYRGELQFTTKEILELERKVVATAEKMQARRALMPDAKPLFEQAMIKHPHLGKEQREALRHLCATKGGVAVICGMAGTGKSTLFAVAREVWEQQGLKVYGAALSGKAAKGLSDATGIPSATVHRTLSALRSNT